MFAKISAFNLKNSVDFVRFVQNASFAFSSFDSLSVNIHCKFN